MRHRSALSSSRLQKHPRRTSASILIFQGFLYVCSIYVRVLACVHQFSMNKILIKDAAQTKKVSRFMNSNFDVHLEGKQIESKIVDVPVKQSPHRLLRGLRVSTWVTISRDTAITVIGCLNKDSIIRIDYWILDNSLRDSEIKALDSGWINAVGYIKTQRCCVINFYCVLPENLQNVHHLHNVLTESCRGIDLSGIVMKIKTNWSVL